jgi:hypothetical protein
MKYIIDRILSRAEKATTEEDKKLMKKVHEEMMIKYCCNVPKVEDLEHLFRRYVSYGQTIDLEAYTQFQTTFELLKNM